MISIFALLLLLLLSELCLCQSVNGTTTTTTTSTSAATTTTTTNNNNTMASTTSAQSTTTTTSSTACSGVVRFDLLTTFDNTQDLVLNNAACNITLTIHPIGGALRCRTLYGCGIGMKSAATKRQEMINTTDSFELNDNEKLLFTLSQVGLLWRASFGQFSAGVDEAKFEVKNVYASANDSALTLAVAIGEWTAIGSIVNDGIELPPTVRFNVTAAPMSAFTVRWLELKLYTPAPTSAPPPMTTLNTTTDLGSTTTLSFFEDAMKNQPIYFWLVVGAIICLCLILIIGGIGCCVIRRGGDSDDQPEGYSMRDMNYTDPDYL